jgi:hypothetical protein
MNRRKLETLLLTLESTPALLAKAVRESSPRESTQRPEGGGFSLVEHLWHLADLEREGFGVRLRRLLTEVEPALSNFDGERAAREREYVKKNLVEGLGAFTLARHRNVDRLRAVPLAAWKRVGHQDGVGRITLADVPRMMADHDRSHTEEIRELLANLRCGMPCDRPGASSAVA